MNSGSTHAILEWTPDDLNKNLDAGNSVFLKIWKEGCGACKLSEPAIDRIVSANDKNIIFAQINSSQYPEILEIADADVLPMFFAFKDKKMVGKVIGFKGIAKLQELVVLLA